MRILLFLISYGMKTMFNYIIKTRRINKTIQLMIKIKKRSYWVPNYLCILFLMIFSLKCARFIFNQIIKFLFLSINNCLVSCMIFVSKVIIMLFFIFSVFPSYGCCFVVYSKGSIIIYHPQTGRPRNPYTKLFMHFPLIYSHIPFKLS